MAPDHTKTAEIRQSRVACALSAKRLHDFGRSGWFAAFFIIGDILMFLFLCFPPSTPGPNRYGSQTDAPR